MPLNCAESRARIRRIEAPPPEATLRRKYNPNSARPRIFDGAAEAKLIALTCSPAPEGFARWSLRLLEEKVVELGLARIVETGQDRKVDGVVRWDRIDLHRHQPQAPGGPGAAAVISNGLVRSKPGDKQARGCGPSARRRPRVRRACSTRAKAALARFSLAVPAFHIAPIAEAARAAEDLGFPVVVKALSATLGARRFEVVGRVLTEISLIAQLRGRRAIMDLLVERVDVWAATIEDRPGGLAQALATLRDAGADRCGRTGNSCRIPFLADERRRRALSGQHDGAGLAATRSVVRA